MFMTWTASDDDAEALARLVEGHLNEFAEVVVSVSYSVSAGRHHVLAVFVPIGAPEGDQARAAAAVSEAEEIVEQAQTG